MAILLLCYTAPYLHHPSAWSAWSSAVTATTTSVNIVEEATIALATTMKPSLSSQTGSLRGEVANFESFQRVLCALSTQATPQNPHTHNTRLHWYQLWNGSCHYSEIGTPSHCCRLRHISARPSRHCHGHLEAAQTPWHPTTANIAGSHTHIGVLEEKNFVLTNSTHRRRTKAKKATGLRTNTYPNPTPHKPVSPPPSALAWEGQLTPNSFPIPNPPKEPRR